LYRHRGRHTALLRARALIAAIDHPEARLKLKEIDETIAQAMGLWLDVSVNREEAAPGMEVVFDLTAVNRARIKRLLSVRNWKVSRKNARSARVRRSWRSTVQQPKTAQARYKIPGDEPPTQPYWLRNPPIGDRYDVRDRSVARARGKPAGAPMPFKVRIGSQTLELVRP